MTRRRCRFRLCILTYVLLCLATLGVPRLHAGDSLRPYESEGMVIAIIADQGYVLLDHEPIQAPGFFMGKMEMPFSVEDPLLLQGLTAGDRVRFRVSEEKKSRILEIQKLPQ